MPLMEEVQIGARALLVIHFTWFGYIAHVSYWGGGGILLVHIKISALMAAIEEGEGGVRNLWFRCKSNFRSL